MFVLSHDALRGTRTDQTIPPDWPSRPTRRTGVVPLLGGGWRGAAAAARRDDRDALLSKLRTGVPPALRCAVWVTNVAWASDPSLTKSEADDRGTLSKVRAIEHGWNVALKSMFPDETDEAEAPLVDLGLGRQNLRDFLSRDHGGNPIPPPGEKSLKRVLYAAHQSLGVDYCPLLPDLSAVMLSVMDESYAYATIRTMLHERDDTESYSSHHFLAFGREEHLAWCKTFADLMHRMYPQTGEALEGIGALAPNALDPIFKRFLVTVLRPEHVKRLMDLYTLDGVEVLFRFGTALMCLYHSNMTEREASRCVDAISWWDGVRSYVRSDKFDFESFMNDLVYGHVEGRFRRREVYPPRSYVERQIELNEAWARNDDSAAQCYDDDAYEETPLGFVEVDGVPVVLAKSAADRQKLAEWLPPSLKSTKLEPIYSSSVHGRTVERFYSHVSGTRHTIVLLEVLGRKGTTLGMFATQAWHVDRGGYGDGECFLFRLKPDPECFKWRPPPPEASTSSIGSPAGSFDAGFDARAGSFDAADGSLPRQSPFADQVMVSGEDFLSMGVGSDGASGLRLNEDLTRGSASPAMGFGNASLLGGRGGDGSRDDVFDVGLVEVYRLVREVDGKPVDQDL